MAVFDNFKQHSSRPMKMQNEHVLLHKVYITSVILMSSDLASKVNEKSDNLVTF